MRRKTVNRILTNRVKDQNKQKADKNQGGSKDGAGRNQASEEPPQNVAPGERFYKNGEGKEGLKGARYVTVQLPEDVAAEVKGESMTGKESKGNRVGAKVPAKQRAVAGACAQRADGEATTADRIPRHHSLMGRGV